MNTHTSTRESVLARATPVLAACLLLAAGCGGEGGGTDDGLSGEIAVDGSSTVFPVTEAMAEEFMRARPGTRVTVNVSGTGGGFEKFCRGETDISDASRPIKESEVEACSANGIDFVEVPVALDGLTVVAHPENDWAQCVTTDELEKTWRPNSTVERWSDVREGWPDRELSLFGPGTASGTFDYFTEAIMGEEDASRTDYSSSEDDNVILMGVGNNVGAMGYFGFAYYVENQDRVKELAMDAGDGCVEPTRQNVESGDYRPLSRPLYIYVKRSSYRNERVVREFVDFYLDNARQLVPEVGYVAFPRARYDSIKAELGGGADAGTAGPDAGDDGADGGSAGGTADAGGA